VGIIQVEPRQLLEEGIRKILVQSISRHLDNILRFEQHTIQELLAKLEQLRRFLHGFRNSFNYLQDYMNIYGLKVWQEEFQRIINFNVEQECNRFLKKVHEGTKSAWQSKVIPIPVYPPVKGDLSTNFIGRISRELLLHTDVKTTIYVHKMSAWYSREEREMVGIRTFDLLIDSIGVFGVIGLTRFYGFSIVKDLQVTVVRIRQIVAKDKNFRAGLAHFVRATEPRSTLIENSNKLYGDIWIQAAAALDPLVQIIAELGQLQLLRRQLANILAFKCKLDSNALFCSLDVMDSALINDVQAHYRNPERPYPGGEQSSLFTEMGHYLENVGLNDPFGKIYITTEPIFDFSATLFLLLLKQVGKFSYDVHLGNRPRNAKYTLDDAPFAIGLVTLMRQFHSSVVPDFLSYIGQYVKSSLTDTLDNQKTAGFPQETKNMLLFVEICEIWELISKLD